MGHTTIWKRMTGRTLAIILNPKISQQHFDATVT